jgi:hypothetical protein
MSMSPNRPSPLLFEVAVPQLDEILALSLIEQGSRLMPLDRAVLMASAFGGLAWDDAARLPLDQRDRILIDARIAALGSSIEFFARCPSCEEGNEAGFDLRALPEAAGQATVTCDVAGERLLLHAPSSRDIGAAALSGEPGSLLAACVKEGEVSADPRFAQAVEAALGEAFPLLDPRFEIACSACDAGFSIRFDIATWLWREIEQLGARAIDVVDRLARVYGWSEGEILGLSPIRRSLYLARSSG